MKIHLVKKQTIDKFIAIHPNARSSFEDWMVKLKSADWSLVNDIKITFKTADLLGKGSDRVVFNIAGNNYRMICKYRFGDSEVHLYICWMGSHAGYSKLCKQNLQYSVWDF